MYEREDDFSWDFADANTKEFTHCYHSYPAMMIPQVARKLLREYRPEGRFEWVLDPYMGSGTTLVESSLIGVNAVGTDINPLAVLLSEVKSSSYELNSLENSLNMFLRESDNYIEPIQLGIDFSHVTNVDFWYSPAVLNQLAFITDWIENRCPQVNRNFFIVALSEVIRETSYTRNGEFKRYRIAKEKLEAFKAAPIELFEKKVRRNFRGLSQYLEQRQEVISRPCSFNTISGFPDEYEDGRFDMVVTSPPYGDSRTTVAYGQFSSWANEWFKLGNAKQIDRLLMGGHVKKDIDFESQSIREELAQIKDADPKRYYEVCGFFRDYEFSIRNVSAKVRAGGRICYVVGNRNVKGVQIPLDFLTAELFEKYGSRHEKTLIRNIPNKKMPSKNSPTNVAGLKIDTMSKEYIVILTKK